MLYSRGKKAKNEPQISETSKDTHQGVAEDRKPTLATEAQRVKEMRALERERHREELRELKERLRRQAIEQERLVNTDVISCKPRLSFRALPFT